MKIEESRYSVVDIQRVVAFALKVILGEQYKSQMAAWTDAYMKAIDKKKYKVGQTHHAASRSFPIPGTNLKILFKGTVKTGDWGGTKYDAPQLREIKIIVKGLTGKHVESLEPFVRTQQLKVIDDIFITQIEGSLEQAEQESLDV
jgi:hypothetical protein